MNSKEETHLTFVPITSKNSASGENSRLILTITSCRFVMSREAKKNYTRQSWLEETESKDGYTVSDVSEEQQTLRTALWRIYDR